MEDHQYQQDGLILLSSFSLRNRTARPHQMNVDVFASLSDMCKQTFHNSFTYNFDGLVAAMTPLIMYLQFNVGEGRVVQLEKRYDFCFSYFPTYVVAIYKSRPKIN